jgi:hypothetical protein
MATNSTTSAPDTIPRTDIKSINGMPIDTVLNLFRNTKSKWFPKYRVSWIIGKNGNVAVTVASNGATLVENLSEEELAELFVTDVWTQKQFAAICFSVVYNKRAIETFRDILYFFGKPNKKDEDDCAFIAHIVRLIHNGWNVDGIMADEVFKLICLKLGWSEAEQRSFIAKLSLKSFYDRTNSEAINYSLVYRTVMLSCDALPPQLFNHKLLKESFRADLEWYNICDTLSA